MVRNCKLYKSLPFTTFDSLASVKTKETIHKNFHVEFSSFSNWGKKNTFDIGNGALFWSQIKRKRNTAGVYLCFLFLLPYIECEYSLEPSRPQCMF